MIEKEKCINFLKKFQFEELEKDSFADYYYNVVFEENEIIVSDAFGYEIFLKSYLELVGFIDLKYNRI